MNGKLRNLWPFAAALMAVVGACVLITLLTGPAPAQAAPAGAYRYVAPTGEDNGKCTTYAPPCRTIQYALEQARDGDIVLIAEGTYPGTVTIDKDVTLDGGYYYTYTGLFYYWNRSTCVPTRTVLDGLDAGRVVSISAGTAVTLNCLTVANGNAGTDPGGGIYAWDAATVTVSSAVISGNRAMIGAGVYAYATAFVLSGTRMINNDAVEEGGGLYLTRTQTVAVQQCEFLDNDASGGSGATIKYADRVEIVAATFGMNKARTSFGGGLSLFETKNVTIVDSLFVSNICGINGGGVYAYSTTLALSNTEVVSNVATRDGGGVCLERADGSRVEGSKFVRNRASRGGGVTIISSDRTRLATSTFTSNTAVLGGGLYLESNAPLLAGNVFSSNTATYGGGLYLQGAQGGVVSGNLLIGNLATGGGGIYLNNMDVSLSLSNNIVVDNEISSGKGAGIHISGGTTRMAHNTLARNAGEEGIYLSSGGIAMLTNTILVSHNVGISLAVGGKATLTATLWGTDTWANVLDWAGSGTILTGTLNFRGDPAFADPDGGDYHIGPGSAAIGKGVDAGVATDIDGDRRIGAPDIGADEFITFTYLPLTLRNYP